MCWIQNSVFGPPSWDEAQLLTLFKTGSQAREWQPLLQVQTAGQIFVKFSSGGRTRRTDWRCENITSPVGGSTCALEILIKWLKKGTHRLRWRRERPPTCGSSKGAEILLCIKDLMWVLQQPCVLSQCPLNTRFPWWLPNLKQLLISSNVRLRVKS